MDKKSLMTNFKVMFTMYLLLVLFVIMFLFSFPIRADAAEVSKWGQYDVNYINNFTSTTGYVYEDYNSDSIKEFIFNKSNEQFFDNSLTISEFYSNYNYIVEAYSASTIRVYVQNYNLVMDYQGLTAIEGNPIKFFFANMTASYVNGTYNNYNGGISVIYSYYIDIDYNSLTYSFSDNNPLLDLNFYNLASSSKYSAIGNPSDSSFLNLNIECIDSFNNNFAWIESWNSSYNNKTLWNQVANYTNSKSASYYNAIDLEFPQLQYVSSGVTPDDDSGDSDTPSWIQSVIDKIEENTSSIDKTNDILEGIGGTFTEGFSGLGQSLNNIYDWLTQNWDLSPIENFLENFSENDYGLDIFITGPIEIFYDLDVNSCEPIIVDIPFLNDDSNIILPCMSVYYSDHIPTFLTWWHYISNALIIYFVGRGCYNFIHDLLDPDLQESATRGLL